MVTIKEKNPLLTKNVIGKTKQFTHDLPPDNFTYGAATVKPNFNVAKLTSDWQFSKQSSDQKMTEKDLVKMNKVAVKEGVVKANQVKQYRVDKNMIKGHRRQQSSSFLSRNASVDVIRTLGDAHSFGKQNRPQTPVKGIISGMYGSEAEDYYSRMAVEKRQEVSI